MSCKRIRLVNGKFATPRQAVRQKLIAPVLMVASMFTSWAIQPAEPMHVNLLTPARVSTFHVPVTYAKDYVHIDARPKTIEEKIRAKFGKNADKAVLIAKCESGMRAEAVGDHKIAYEKNGKSFGKSYGPFQIRHLPGRPDPSELLDVDTNIEMAYKISNGGTNWRAWYTCAKKGGLL